MGRTIQRWIYETVAMSKKQSVDQSQDHSAAEDEVARLRAENDTLRQEIEDLRYELDVEACHVAGLTAQIKALIAESDACSNKPGHPLVERAEYVHSRTGEKLVKTKAFPLYRDAFDAEARELGIDDPDQIRA